MFWKNLRKSSGLGRGPKLGRAYVHDWLGENGFRQISAEQLTFILHTLVTVGRSSGMRVACVARRFSTNTAHGVIDALRLRTVSLQERLHLSFVSPDTSRLLVRHITRKLMRTSNLQTHMTLEHHTHRPL